ncbi:hypothetical protein [Streptomyces soliscabiei]|uniref:hypothetical protein n=1 Tax=Streptomyces soliscabiei TaxID=588897 RepID=UPI0029A04018|nr:hypothetical protein [Streptomyces sp. NY05-11A]MDX2679224.1 hypothetical protein [Streptomyces sp. NY05-11A]
MPGQRTVTPRCLLAVVTDRSVVAEAAATALHDLTTGSGRKLHISAVTAHPSRPQPAEEHATVIGRARRFLDHALPDAEFALLVTDSLDVLPEALTACADGNPAALRLLVIDHGAYRTEHATHAPWQARLESLTAALPGHITFEPSPLSVHLYGEPGATLAYEAGLFTRRWMPDEDWVVATDLVCAFTDSLQMTTMERFRRTSTASGLATALANFLQAEAGARWGLHYYTGSVVADFIDHLENHAQHHGNPIVRGPSEHSLVCSALARWQLEGAPFLITVTSGMADEFRGTLANLRAAQARGFVICPDSLPGDWHPFQGTIHGAEDSRAVMRARGLAVVHCDGTERLNEALSEAFTAYAEDKGPVVLFVTRDVLESPSAPTPSPEPEPCACSDAYAEEPELMALEALVQLINEEPVRLLCQAGPMPEEEGGLLRELARRAAVALADSLPHPGSVSRYHAGTRTPEYLGTLSLYGHSARVFEFLHHDGRLRPPSEQALIFLNSRIAQVDTPFSASALSRMRTVQVVEDRGDVAPFTTLALTGPSAKILRLLLDRLDVDPHVLALRRSAIEATRDSFSDVVGLIPVRPMTPNYFFQRLHELLDTLIRQTGYTYTGVYDVGRAGLSAVCNLPRTGPGFSGWFGRALMGDALQALPGILADPRENVLVFTGDGAAALVPDILPTIIRQTGFDGAPLRGNLSIFRFVNGSHSVIRTYRETLRPSAVSAQTGVPSLREDDWAGSFGTVFVRHRTLNAWDYGLAEELRSPRTVNLYSVPMAHNNEGDGLSLLSATGWQRDELSSRTRALTAPSGSRARSATR